MNNSRIKKILSLEIYKKKAQPFPPLLFTIYYLKLPAFFPATYPVEKAACRLNPPV